MEINTERYSHLKGFVGEMISESLVRYMLKKSGYKVLKGEGLGYLLKKRDSEFKDLKQKLRIEKCIELCNITNKKSIFRKNIGIPDYFVYNETGEFFIEVKANTANLSESQKKVFPLIEKIIPIKVAKMGLEFEIKHKDLIIYDFPKSEEIKTKSIESIKKMFPDLEDNELNRIFKILNKREKFPYDLLDLDEDKIIEESYY